MVTMKKFICPGLFWPFAILALLAAGCKPSGPGALLKGEQLIRQGEHDRAVEMLQLATQQLSTNAQAWNHLGLAYHGNNQAELAFRAYRHALSVDHKLAAPRYNLGCLYLEKNNPEAAIDQLTSYTLLEPRSLNGWLKLAAAYLQSGNHDAAERTYRSILQVNARVPQALNGMGLVQAYRKKPLDALYYFNAALTHDPSYGTAMLNAAVLAHRSLNNRPLALQRYREYLALKPRPANSREVEKIARDIDVAINTPEAESSSPAPATRAPELPPEVAAVLRPPGPSNPPSSRAAPPETVPDERTSPPATPAVTRAPPTTRAHEAAPSAPPPGSEPPVTRPAESSARPADNTSSDPTGRRSPVVARADTAAPVPSGDAEARPPRRNLVERLNPFTNRTRGSRERETALRPTEPAPRAGPRVPDLRPTWPRYSYLSPSAPRAGNRREAERSFAAGVSAQKPGRYSEAAGYYERAISVDPAYFEAHFNLGLAAFQLSDWRKSLAAYEHALALKPDSADARYNFALALKWANYPQDAAEQLQRILKERPNETRAHLLLANLYAQQLQQSRLARQHYLKVLEKDPNHAEAGKIRFWLGANP